MRGRNFCSVRRKINSGDILYPPFERIIPKTKCVYKIEYEDGGFYYGSTKCFDKRLFSHICKSAIKILHVEIVKLFDCESEMEVLEKKLIILSLHDLKMKNRQTYIFFQKSFLLT